MANLKKIETPADYNDFIKNDGLIIVKLSANWCNPCKVLGETIKNLDASRISNVMIGEIDVDSDEMEDIVDSCNVRSIPVLIYYKNGEEVKRSVGLVTADTIYKTIEELS